MMKHPHNINTLVNAINYKTICPICLGTIKINDKNVTVTTSNLNEIISLGWQNSMYNKVVVLLENNSIHFEPPHTVPLYGMPPGKLYNALQLQCVNCCQYSYTIIVIFDLSNFCVFDVALGYECLSILDNDILHEIKNNYQFKETIYTCFYDIVGFSIGDKSVTLPLIDLDFSVPKRTLERVRNLVVFT